MNFGLGDVDLSRGLSNNSLSRNALSLLVSFGLFLVIFPDAVQEASSAGGKLQVLNANVDALRNNAVANLLVDDHTNGSGVDVEDASSAAVIVLIGHALVNSAVDSNINDVANAISGEGLGDMDCSVLSEALSELVSGSSFIAVAVSHNKLNNQQIILSHSTYRRMLELPTS